ncbi:MAG: ABC transporter permease [Proteobacteria bacterium]|nr:ABC transporter permease [Pseudomonadota bacterium]
MTEPRATALPLWRLAWRLLCRDLASGRLTVMLAATVIAVASTVAVSLLVTRVDRALVAESSALLAGDLAVLGSAPPPHGYVNDATALGLRHARVANLRSVVGKGEQLQLVQLKAVDDAYPLRGQLLVAERVDAPAQAISHGPPRGEVWAEAKLAGLLQLAPGDTLTIGSARLRLSRILVLEPDRGSDLFSIAPRVLMHYADLAATGLVVPGSRVTYTTLLAGSAATIARYREALELRRGDSVQDPRSARPEMRAALSQAERFLSLAAFAGVMLAAIGIALAATGYAEMHEGTVAILKTLGLTRRAVVMLLCCETLYLALAATVLGDGTALLLERVLVQRLVPMAEFAGGAPAPLALLHGAWVAMVALCGFAIPALARLGRLPVTAILSRDRTGLPDARPWRLLGMVLAFIAIAPWHSGNPRLVAMALGGMLVSALLLAATAWGLVRLLGRLRNQTRMSWRFGLASVARRARLSVLQTTAIGLGLAVILLLGLVRNDLFRQWSAHLPPDAPNQFLINIQSDEVAALRDFLRAHAKLTADFYPMVRGRLTAINGAVVVPDNYSDQRARRLADREFNLSTALEMKSDNRIVAGRWWTPQARAELSVEQGIAETLGLVLGDELTFLIADREVHGRITSLRKVDWENFQVNFFVVTTPELLASAPATYITSFRLEGAEPGLMAEMVERFPSVTVIDIDALMRQVRQVMDRVAQALTWVFLCALAAGGLVLAAAVQASQKERLKDTVLLRTLGASRRFVRSAVLCEFVVIGVVAGTLASGGALLTAGLLATRVLDIPYQPDWRIPVHGIVAAVLALALIGWRVAARILGAPVADGLREAQ